MSLEVSISIHLEHDPVEAVVRGFDDLNFITLVLERPNEYSSLTLFFSAAEKERVEKIAALLNEITARPAAGAATETEA